MIDDEDLVSKSGPVVEENKKDLSDIIQDIEEEKVMSARERNQAKRKARMTNRSTKRAKIDKTSSECHIRFDVNGWPFSLFCEQLYFDLYASHWEIRHGAALALLEIVTTHGVHAGKDFKDENEEFASGMEELGQGNLAWLEDCSVRLLCVLLLDRFGDYSSGLVVAPVREITGQVMGIVTRFMSLTQAQTLALYLTNAANHPVWHIRHGALLGLKYVLAAKERNVESLLPSVLDCVIQRLQDSISDICAVAANCLIPVTSSLVNGHSASAQHILNILWEQTLSLDDTLESTSSTLGLLAALYEVSNFEAQCGNLVDLIPRLWCFMRHPTISARTSAMKTLAKMARKMLSEDCIQEIGSDFLRFLFQSIVMESEETIQRTIQEIWESIVFCNNQELLMQFVRSHFASCLAILNTPISAMVDWSLIVIIRPLNAQAHTDKDLDAPQITSELVVEMDNETRMRGLKALAQLVSVLDEWVWLT